MISKWFEKLKKNSCKVLYAYIHVSVLSLTGGPARRAGAAPEKVVAHHRLDCDSSAAIQCGEWAVRLCGHDGATAARPGYAVTSQSHHSHITDQLTSGGNMVGCSN